MDRPTDHDHRRSSPSRRAGSGLAHSNHGHALRHADGLGDPGDGHLKGEESLCIGEAA